MKQYLLIALAASGLLAFFPTASDAQVSISIHPYANGYYYQRHPYYRHYYYHSYYNRHHRHHWHHDD